MNRNGQSTAFLASLCVWALLLHFTDAAPPETENAAEVFDVERFREKAAGWEKEIQLLEARDETESHAAGSILFAGSSSIRLWDNIAEDMAPYHPIQRGYGGASLADLVFYIDRIIATHKFRALVIFAGNDIAGNADDRSPEEVARLFRSVLATVRKRFPETPVFYVAVTPTPSRWAVWPQVRDANRRVQQVCDTEPHTYFIATESVYLDAAGQPRAEFFLEDRLHQNNDGYQRWAAVIKSHLDAVLGGAGTETIPPSRGLKPRVCDLPGRGRSVLRALAVSSALS